jgi:hypothetical protein
MKRRIPAVTLVELIISTLIVSMVVAGVFASEYALRRMSEKGAGDVQINIQVKTIAELIRSTVKIVHGDPSDIGIDVDIANKTLCFRHDVDTGSGFTPGDYTDDDWTCYTQIGTDVYLCELGAEAPCTNADMLIGSLVSDQFGGHALMAPTVTNDTVNQVFSFSMTLVGRRDPSVGADILVGIPDTLTSGTVDNPQAVINVWENIGEF